MLRGMGFRVGLLLSMAALPAAHGDLPGIDGTLDTLTGWTIASSGDVDHFVTPSLTAIRFLDPLAASSPSTVTTTGTVSLSDGDMIEIRIIHAIGDGEESDEFTFNLTDAGGTVIPGFSYLTKDGNLNSIAGGTVDITDHFDGTFTHDLLFDYTGAAAEVKFAFSWMPDGLEPATIAFLDNVDVIPAIPEPATLMLVGIVGGFVARSRRGPRKR